MDVNEAIAEVVALTARPDKATQALLGINAAISYFTVKSSFAKDLIETSIPINNTLYGDTIVFNNNVSIPEITRFRKFKYIKIPGILGYLRHLSPEQIFTPAGKMQKNVYYIAGDNLTYILTSLSATLEVGYYQYPKLLDTGTEVNHWMLDIFPWAVIDLAAARIFKNIGDESSYKTHMSTGNEFFMMHKNDHEDSVLHVAS